VSNTGSVAGKEAVLLFVTDWARRVTPENKLLKRFEKVALGAGESREVSFTLSPEADLSYIGIEGRRVLEAGDFYLGLGPQVDCRCAPVLPVCLFACLCGGGVWVLGWMWAWPACLRLLMVGLGWVW
jgi:hypothetical protein